jgi:hypothetical protein
VQGYLFVAPSLLFFSSEDLCQHHAVTARDLVSLRMWGVRQTEKGCDRFGECVHVCVCGMCVCACVHMCVRQKENE